MIKPITKIAILIFLYYCVYHLYVGFINPIPAPGDSWDYHIPISKSILNGSFISLPNVRFEKWYFPGSSEAINSVLILLHIPLTISNIIAIIFLFFSCWKLGRVFKLNYNHALLFAASICTLNVIVRWMNAVSIDVWLTVFFTLTWILLENPKKTYRYFISIGITLGMMVGTKFFGVIFALILLLLYSKRISKVIDLPKLVVSLFFITFLGFFLVYKKFYYNW